MLDLVWDVWQWQRVNDVEQQQLESGLRVTDQQERLKALQQTVDRLALTSAAMWSLVKQRTDLTDQDLLARIRRMEGEQAEVKLAVAKCPKCGRTIPQRKHRCIYCGEERESAAADSVIGH